MKRLPPSVSNSLRAAVFAAGALVLAGCSVFGIRSGTEQLNYEIVAEPTEDLEIRRYPPAVAAEVRVPRNADDPRSTAFRKLFRYITGANEGQRDIAMTAPVSIDNDGEGQEIAMTAPVSTETEGEDVVMRFFLPSDIAFESAPQPTDADVALVEVGARTVAVLRYTWSTGPEKAARKRAELLDMLEESGWTPTGPAYSMFYDPPWTLPFLRRNEAAVPVAQ
jgi:hypothetical protein